VRPRARPSRPTGRAAPLRIGSCARPHPPARAGRAATLTQESKKFYKRSNQVKRNMCMKNAKMMALIGCLITLVLIIIIVPVAVNAAAAAKAVQTANDATNSTND
jgi:hypothetical protein